jgi:hypothetical protein
MKVIYIGLSDRIGPSTVDICKRMMLLNTASMNGTDGTSNDLYSFDSNNRWGCLKTNFITLEEHRTNNK